MQDKDRTETVVLGIIGAFVVSWIALLIAPYVSGGLPGIIPNLPEVMNHPFHVVFCDDTLKTVLIMLTIYGLIIGVYVSSNFKFRRGEEHGSAQWGSAKALNRKYSQSPPENNKILTQNVRIGYNGRKHLRNLNTLVVGGSGAGKTRYVVKPNILQAGIGGSGSAGALACHLPLCQGNHSKSQVER